MNEELDKSLKRAKTREILKKAQKFTNLWNDENFQNWRNEVIKKRLEVLKNIACNQDVSTKEGVDKAIKAIMRYQELKSETEDIFKLWEQAEEELRKQLDSNK